MHKQSEGTVLVIGASRGLGLALVEEWLTRGWQVIATARDAGSSALKTLAKTHNKSLTSEQLDMTDAASIKALRQRLAERSLNMLFINAGVALGSRDRVNHVSDDEFMHIMRTNTLGPMRVLEALEGLVTADGTIALMSSSLGSVSLNTRGGWEVYRASKAALNTLMRSYAARTADSRRALALIDPGWVRTDMGGPEATLEIEQSIPHVVDALLAHRGQPGLCYFNYLDETLPW